MSGFQDWKEYIHNYRFHSIFFRNLVLVILLVLVPVLCVTGIAMFSYDRIYKSEEKAYTDEMCTLIFDDVESLFNDVRSKMILFSLDDDVELFFTSPNWNADDYDHLSIQSLINTCKITMDEIEGIYLYAPRIGRVYTNSALYTYESFYQKAFVDRWDSEGEQIQIASIDAKDSGARSDVLCMYYSVRFSRDDVGVVAVALNKDRLNKRFVYGENVGVSFSYDEQTVFQNSTVSEAAEEHKLQETDISISKLLNKYHLTVSVYMNRQPLRESIRGIAVFFMGLIAVLLLLSLVYAFYISVKIYDPIVNIMSALEEPAKINESGILQNKNELSYIMRTISHSALQKNNIEEELLMRIELLKKAQAVALQAQINPHFINNTLETINWMAITHLGSENEISEMLNCLGALMHVSLGNTDTFVTLEEEIEYVKKYLFIQQKRIEGGFDVEWDIPEELHRCRCIRLMLQPLVENAIHYGIKPYGAGGKLKIAATRADDKVRIFITDSGMGLTADRVNEINESIHREVIKESDHIGLSNVNQRILLAFGEPYGVSLQSHLLRGTSVTLVLPFRIDDPDMLQDFSPEV